MMNAFSILPPLWLLLLLLLVSTSWQRPMDSFQPSFQDWLPETSSHSNETITPLRPDAPSSHPEGVFEYSPDRESQYIVPPELCDGIRFSTKPLSESLIEHLDWLMAFHKWSAASFIGNTPLKCNDLIDTLASPKKGYEKLTPQFIQVTKYLVEQQKVPLDFVLKIFNARTNRGRAAKSRQAAAVVQMGENCIPQKIIRDPQRFNPDPLDQRTTEFYKALMASNEFAAETFTSTSPLMCNVFMDLVLQTELEGYDSKEYRPKYSDLTRFMADELRIPLKFISRVISARKNRKRAEDGPEYLNFVYAPLVGNELKEVKKDLITSKIDVRKVLLDTTAPRTVVRLTGRFVTMHGEARIMEQLGLLERYLVQRGGKKKKFIAEMHNYIARHSQPQQHHDDSSTQHHGNSSSTNQDSPTEIIHSGHQTSVDSCATQGRHQSVQAWPYRVNGSGHIYESDVLSQSSSGLPATSSSSPFVRFGQTQANVVEYPQLNLDPTDAYEDSELYHQAQPIMQQPSQRGVSPPWHNSYSPYTPQHPLAQHDHLSSNMANAWSEEFPLSQLYDDPDFVNWWSSGGK